MDLYFNGIPQPVRFTGCETLLPRISVYFHSWPFRTVPAATDVSPAFTVRALGDTLWRFTAPWLPEGAEEDTEAGFLCSLGIDLANAFFYADPSLLCLHCAAVELGDALVVFPNTNRAGKSTLAVRLLADEVAVYADDLLAVTKDGQGMSFGIPPRLRLPLPARETALKRFFTVRKGMGDADYQFVAPRTPGLAPFGACKPIAAFVVLDRGKGRGSARLSRLPGTLGLQSIINRNVMRPQDAMTVFARSKALADAVPCWKLSYSGLDEAAALLKKNFTGPKPVLAVEAVQPEPLPAPPRKRRASRAKAMPDPHRRFVRHEGMAALPEQQELFLVQEEKDAIFHLNPVAAAVWEMLASPLSVSEACELLGTAFPQVPPQTLVSDVTALFNTLRKKNLIR